MKQARLYSRPLKFKGKVSEKSIQLAVFTLTHEGETLAQRMASWNEAHPEWAIGMLNNFARDSLQAVKHLIAHAYYYQESEINVLCPWCNQPIAVQTVAVAVVPRKGGSEG